MSIKPAPPNPTNGGPISVAGGRFNLKFEGRLSAPSASANPDPLAAPELSPASLFTALQEELGLKLERTKGPVEVLVIDTVSKPIEV